MRHLPRLGFYIAFSLWIALLIFNLWPPTDEFLKASASSLLQIFIVLAVSFGLTQFRSKEKQKIDLMISFISQLNVAFDCFERECLVLQEEKAPSVRRVSHQRASMFGRQVQNYFDLLKEMTQGKEDRKSVQEAENDWKKVYERFGETSIEQPDEIEGVGSEYGNELILAKSNIKTKFDWLVAHFFFSNISIKHSTMSKKVSR